MCAYTHLPTGAPATLLVQSLLTSSPAPFPRMRKSPMWDTSNAPDFCLTVMCSSIMDVYWMGMSQPANHTILAPSVMCRSWRGVLCIGTASVVLTKSFVHVTVELKKQDCDGRPIVLTVLVYQRGEVLFEPDTDCRLLDDLDVPLKERELLFA